MQIKENNHVSVYLLRKANKLLIGYISANDNFKIHGSREIKQLLSSPQANNGNKVVCLKGELTESGQVFVRFQNIVSADEEMLNLFYEASLSAKSDVPIHLTGETGTGKELLAQAIHEISERKDFLPINCAAIPSELIETELFGHARGAFTGATYSREGAFMAASHGTLFLDEIGEIPLSVQAKLLRTIETGEVRRLGEMKTALTKARVITSSNRDLSLEIMRGNFREDLFYRISCITLKIPPLWERKDDIEMIARDMLKEFGNGHKYYLTTEVAELLKSHHWSGNVRELKNCLKRAIIRCSGSVIGVSDVELQSQQYGNYKEAMARICDGQAGLTNEELAVLSEISKYGGRKNPALKNLGIPRSTFYKNTYPKLRKMGLR